MKHLLSYDISNDKRRKKVAKLLKNYGQRVQYSVFESNLDGDKLDEAKMKLEEIIDVDNDNIRIYSLCSTCKDKFIELGKEVSIDIEEELLIL